MILPTMTPEEKIRQAEQVMPYIKAIASRATSAKYYSLKKAKRFPAFLFLRDKEIAGMGKWTVVITVHDSNDIRKGRYTCGAYQTFHVSHSKNPINNGTGIYVCRTQMNLGTWFVEYPPHYFSRLRERFIQPKGIVQPDFNGLITELFRMQHFASTIINEGTIVSKGEDGLYDVIKDESLQRKKGYDNFCSFHKDGISLGVCVNRKYFLHTTFVDNSLLKRTQVEMQKENMRTLNQHALKFRYDKNTAMVKEGTVEGHLEFGLEKRKK